MYYDVHISLFPVIKALEPVRLNKWSLPEVNLETMVTSEPDVFVRRDLSGVYSSHMCESLTLERLEVL